jgi:thiosulfate dehydrogenase
VDGAYGSGSHATGIAGIFGTSRSAQEVFDLIKTTHGFGDAGLADEDILDLARFVLEAQIDTDEIIDGSSNTFIGSVDSGTSTYDTSCAPCHGADGTQILFDDGTVTLGGLADDNPWEVQHKIRFGQPGTAMPPQLDVLTVPEVGDLGAFVQSLPLAPTP